MPDTATNDASDAGKPRRIGIIGAGNIAINGHRPTIRDDPRVTVAAVCRRNKELLAAQQHRVIDIPQDLGQ